MSGSDVLTIEVANMGYPGGMQPPGPYLPSAASLPGAGLPTPAHPNVKNLGIASLVLSIMMIVWSLYQIASSLLAIPMMKAQRGMMAGPSSGFPPETAEMFDNMHAHMLEVSLWHGGRYVLFLVASGVLLYISVRLLNGNPSFLPMARKWAWGALGVLIVSILLQATLIVPKQLAMQKGMFDSIVTGSGGPGDFASSMEVFSTVWIVLMMVGGAILFAIWPIVLLVLAGRMEDRLRATEGSG